MISTSVYIIWNFICAVRIQLQSDMIKTKSVVGITGASGHIASALIPLLLSKGYRLKLLQHNQKIKWNHHNIELVSGNILEPESLHPWAAECTTIIHCAAKISIESNSDPTVYAVNFKGTKNTFYAAKEAGVEVFIHLSSIHAFELPTVSTSVINESSPYCSDQSHLYDRSKRDAQRFILEQSGMRIICLCPTGIIGPFDQGPSLMGQAILDIYNSKLPAMISGGFDFCDVREIAQSILAALENKTSKGVYLLSGHWSTARKLLNVINACSSINIRILVLSPSLAYAFLPIISIWTKLKKSKPLYTRETLDAWTKSKIQFDSSRAQRELLYHCRGLEETIKDTIEWFKTNNYII